MATLYLASSSPRRKEILTSLGIPYTIVVRPVDETPLPQESACSLVIRLARKKAEALRGEYSSGFVLGADNTVELDGVIYGKPLDQEDACAMLMKFSGRVVNVHTGHALVNLSTGEVFERLTTSGVHFKSLTQERVMAYVKTGEPMDKSGSFAVQGLARELIEKTTGSISNIVGLDEDVVVDWYNNVVSL